jgi:hypothetical protein
MFRYVLKDLFIPLLEADMQFVHRFVIGDFRNQLGLHLNPFHGRAPKLVNKSVFEPIRLILLVQTGMIREETGAGRR